jgi:hypothetical protein
MKSLITIIDELPSTWLVFGNGLSIQPHYQELLIRTTLVNSMNINIGYQYFPHSTMTLFRDYNVWESYKDDLVKLPLLVTCDDVDKKHLNYPNMQKIKVSYETLISNDNLLTGYPIFYGNVTGTMALHLACCLTKPNANIYLFGFDYGSCRNINGDKITHFFQDQVVDYMGFGKTKTYTKTYADRYFDKFKNIGCNIYNVVDTPISQIDSFPKISYAEFFQQHLPKIELPKISQPELQTNIHQLLNHYKALK